MNYKILLFGPQGSGKGTQGEKLSKLLNIPLIVTGNIFRKNIKENTELGKQVVKYINKGELVPDALTIKMIADRLNQNDCANGFILDGFPRTIAQAEALEQIIKATHVLLIDISDQEAIRRIADRRVCLNCGMTYHLIYNPPKTEGVCDGCQAELVQRDDDTEATLKKRLKLYYQESKPILDKFESQGILYKVNGEQSIDEVWDDIKKIFK